MANKTALVIGGGSDIGASVVSALHNDDWNVIWTYCNTDRDLPGTKHQIDLTQLNQLVSFINSINTKVDLIFTAAIPFWEADNTDFQAYLKILPFLTAHMYLMTEGSKLLNQGGKIISTLGQCVNQGIPGASFYSAVFAHLHNWSKSTHKTEGRQGKFHVCNLLVGPVNTREWASSSEEMVAEYKNKVLRFIEPEELASQVVFIANSSMPPTEFLMDAYY